MQVREETISDCVHSNWVEIVAVVRLWANGYGHDWEESWQSGTWDKHVHERNLKPSDKTLVMRNGVEMKPPSKCRVKLKSPKSLCGDSAISSPRQSLRQDFRKSVQSSKFDTFNRYKPRQWENPKDTSSECFSMENASWENSHNTSKTDGLKKKKVEWRGRINPVRQEGSLPSECLGHSCLAHFH